MSEENKFTPYLRQDRLPHIFCPGCGNGTIMNAFIEIVILFTLHTAEH